MVEEASLEFRIRRIKEWRNYILDEIKRNDSMSEKNEKVCKYLNYVEHLPSLSSATAAFFSISAFTSLVAIPVGITSSVIGIKICAITEGV